MFELRDYQKKAIQQALKYPGFGLFLEQRTGKTPVACEIVNIRNPQRLLIVCPKIAIDIWINHLKGIRAEIQILNFESLWGARKRIKRWAPDFVIGDETHRIKNRKAKQSKALRLISKTAKWRLALTGTPLEGKIADAWAQMDFIDPKVFGPWKEFADHYLVYGGFKKKEIIGIKNEDDFRVKFKSRFFRVLLEDVKETRTDIALPNIVNFDLKESRQAYDSMEEKFVTEINRWIMVKKVRVDGSFHYVKKRRQVVAPRVITQAMKLHQLSGGFILDDERIVHRFGDEKLLHLGALLLALGRSPTVIIVRFLPELYRIQKLCRQLGKTVTLVSGSHPFKTFETDIIVVQIRSGISIDLSRAEEMIFYSWTYSFLDYNQALFRIRSYTSRRARYHYLIARNTIDEVLYEVVTTKASFVKTVVNKYRRE